MSNIGRLQRVLAPPTVASNRLTLIAGMLLICLAAQSRAEVAEDSSSADQPAAARAILFGSEGNLWVINSDGSGLEQLTHLKANEVSPSASWSPDGNRIAYVDYRRLEGSPLLHPNVWVMNADGSGVMPLTGEPKRTFYNLTWSADGHKLAAAADRMDFDEDKQIKYLSNDIFMVNADGSGAKPLLQLTGPYIHFQSISWSPDGRKIAFLLNRSLDGDDGQKYKGLSQNIWVMDADGSHVIPLTRFTGQFPWIWEMVWSPDSRRVTYTSNRALDGSDAGGAGMNIWVSNADGSGSFPLTRFKHVACNFINWSPDGSRLTFSANDSLDGSDTGNSVVNIWVMKTDGSAPVPVTHETIFERSNDRPAWSPDGSLIASVSCINSTSAKPRSISDCKLSIMKADGTGARQLTEQNVGVLQWRP
jgi:Tol biopolymer transport system component